MWPGASTTQSGTSEMLSGERFLSGDPSLIGRVTEDVITFHEWINNLLGQCQRTAAAWECQLFESCVSVVNLF